MEELPHRTQTLSAAIRDRYGVGVPVAPLGPGDDAPARILALASELARHLRDRRPRDDAPAVTWTPLPPARRPASPGDRGDAVQRLAAWATARGARFDALELCVDGLGHGIARARRALGAGERVISMPDELLITPDALLAGEGGPARTGLSLHRPAEALAALLPLELERAASPWRPVLDALPPVLPGGAHCRPDLEDLAGTSAWSAAAAACRQIAELHRGLPSELAARLPLAALAWGHGIVRSRAFTIRRDGRRCAIVPIIDMLDHGKGEARLDHDEATGEMVVTTVRAFAAGEPVHLDYGPIGNGRLLVDYGFTLPDNRHDVAELVFPVADDPRVDLAAHLLWNLPLGRPASVVVRARFDDSMKRALSIARLRAASFDELAGAMFVGGQLPALGAAVEHAALAHLATAAKDGIARLRRPPADLHDAPPTPTRWQRECEHVRRGERAVLDSVLALACHPDDGGDDLRSGYQWARS